MGFCVNCGDHRRELLKTAYGDYICEDCWDSYICSDEGKVEYLIGIYREDYPMSEFDAEFLGEVIDSYLTNRNLLNFTEQEISEIEQQARVLGLL